MTDEFDLTISDSFFTPGRRKNNFTATASPTVNDDSGDGYEVGSRWFDTTADEVWDLVDSTLGAAVWVQGGGGLENQSLFVDTSVSGAHTADRDDGWTHDLTLVGNATITPDVTTFVSGDAIDLRLIIRQDGTGGWTLAWGGTIAWDTFDGNPPDMPTDPDAMLTVGLLSVDDGATWIGYSGGSGGADLSAIDFLVGTASGLLSGEIVVGTTPGGELGGTWASPTVDTVHSGSSHASAVSASNAVGPILISDTHSTPIIFGDILLTEDEDDILYADV